MLPRLASVTGHCEAGDADPLAPKRLPGVLALEITCARPAGDSRERAAADCDDGGSESDLGRGANCRRTPGEARNPRVAADGVAVHAVAPAAREAGDTSMEHLRAEPRTIGPRQRFLCRCDGDVPPSVCVRGARSRHAEDSALERDGASDSGRGPRNSFG